MVQSENTEPSAISKKIDTFIQQSHEALIKMKDSEFTKICKSCESNYCQSDKHLAEQSQTFYNRDIITHNYFFDMRERFREEINALRKDEVLGVFRKMLIEDRKVMEVHVVCEQFKEEADRNLRKRNFYHIGDVDEFHEGCDRYEDRYVFKCL